MLVALVSGWRPGGLLNVLHCTDAPTTDPLAPKVRCAEVEKHMCSEGRCGGLGLVHYISLASRTAPGPLKACVCEPGGGTMSR